MLNLRISLISLVLLLTSLSGYTQTASFTADVTSGCGPLVVQFTNTSTGTFNQSSWDLGLGGSPILQTSPAAIYSNPGTYTVCLTVTDTISGLNNTDCITNFITVFQSPSASFIVDDSIGCFPFTASFTDQSTPGDAAITNYLWGLGAGQNSTLQNPSAVYGFAGTFPVTLSVEDANGCTDQITIPNYITAISGPTASFSAIGATTSCIPPLTVTFDNSSSPTANAGDNIYIWNYGDGTSDTLFSLGTHNYTYTTSGIFDVTLTVVDTLSNSCSDATTDNALVNISGITASFTQDTTAGCANGLTVQFSNTSSPSGDSFFWDFGDGTTSTLENPSHLFSGIGCYEVTFIASSMGCSDTTTFNCINLEAPPVVAFTSDIQQSCNSPMTVNFTDNSVNAVIWQWDFGDGSTSNIQNPTHTYTTPGNYDVTLTVGNAVGCINTLTQNSFIDFNPPVADFLRNNRGGCAPRISGFTDQSTSNEPIVSWQWDFGDGSTSNLQNPSHNFTTVGCFDVTLIVTTTSGCTDTTTIVNAVCRGAKPVANFSSNITLSCSSNPIQFTDLSTGNPTNWLWDFGDGGTSNQQNPSYMYSDTGSFDVTLITSSLGCRDTVTLNNYIQIEGPVALFSRTRNCPDEPFIFIFGNQSIGGTNFSWDFGDPNSTMDTSTLFNPPPYDYGVSGVFQVSLIVTDIVSGCVDTFTSSVNTRSPMADFNLLTDQGCTGDSIIVTNSTVFATEYEWAGSGIMLDSSTGNGFLTFPSSGTYPLDITLIASNSFGCADTLNILDTVYISEVNAIFTEDISSGCAPHSANFTDQSTSGLGTITAWNWNFGDGTGLSSLQNPAYTFINPNSYNVDLIATDSYGCSDTVTNVIQATYPQPSFTLDDLTLCQGQTVNITNTSTGTGLTHVWDFGDGTTDTTSNPSHSYSISGPVTICLTTTDINGCDSTICTNPGDVVISNVTANFTQDSTFTSCPPLPVNFTNLSTGNITDYLWDFGDGNQAILADPSTIYTSPGSFDVSLIVTDNLNCSDTLTQTSLITIGGPTATIAIDPLQGCAPVDVSITLVTDQTATITTDFIDGQTMTNIVSGDSTFINHTYTNPGFYSPIFLLQDSVGCSNLVTIPDTIFTETLSASFTSDTSQLCGTGSINYMLNLASSDTLNTNFEWLFDGGMPMVSTDTNPSITYNTSGVYSTTLIASNSYCSDTITIDSAVSIGEQPVLAFTPVIADPCIPQSFTFNNQTSVNGDSIVSWIWDFGDGNSSTLVNPSHNYAIVSSPAMFNVTLYATSLIGCMDSLTIPVTVFPLINPSNGSDETVCLGDTVNLVSGGGVNYQWLALNGSTAPIACNTCPVTTVVPDQSTDYQITIDNGGNCIYIDTISITVNSVIADIMPSDTLICLGNSVDLLASGGSLYNWSPGIGLTNSFIPNPVATPNTTTLYTVTVTDNSGCSATDSILIEVGNPPIVNISNDTIICPGDMASLIATPFQGSPPFTYQWNNVSSLSCSNCPNPLASPVVTTNYQVTVTDLAGCEVLNNVTVILNTNPIYSILPDTSICPGDSVELVITPSNAAAQYNWFPAISLSDPSISNPVASPTNSTTYTVDLTFANQCTARDTVEVSIVDLSMVGLTADTLICLGDTIQLFANGTGSILWSPDSLVSDSSSFSPLVFPDQTTTFVAEFNEQGCSVVDSLIVEVITQAEIYAQDTTICEGESIQLNVTGTADNFSWSPPEGLSDTNIADPIANPSTSQTYTVIGAIGTCLPDTATVNLTVRPLPEVDVTADHVTFQVGQVVQLEMTSDAPAGTIIWTPTQDLSCVDCSTPVAVPDSSILYTVQVYDEFGCYGTDSIQLRRLTECTDAFIVVPNAFSPNNDGLNDELFVRGTPDIISFKIFDRWGTLLYSTKDINQGWNGIYNGKPVPAGVYVYFTEVFCNIDGSTIVKRGNVTILR